jgi:hypothetical protein
LFWTLFKESLFHAPDFSCRYSFADFRIGPRRRKRDQRRSLARCCPARVPAGVANCKAATTGAIRYNSATPRLEFCNGTAWQPTNNAGKGYFVVSKTTWNGNLGGIDGANSKCLTELGTTNTGWLGYATANALGLLTAAHVKAWLCSSVNTYYGVGVCQGLNPNTTYAFADANNVAHGGATFTTDGQGMGPGDSANWSGATYFGASYTYWTARLGNDGSNLWASNVSGSGAGFSEGACTNGTNSWTSSSSGDQGDDGASNNTGSGRWILASPACNTTLNLICTVNP